MSLLSCTRVALAFGLSLAVFPTVQVGTAVAQKDETKFKKDTVTFRTVDAVDLKGSYWTPVAKSKNACVLLLHNFSKQKGGDRNADGWDTLAEELAKEGYTVLSFDFRGHGDSKGVAKEFWNKQKFPQNYLSVKSNTTFTKDYPTSIDYKDFQSNPGANYYVHLVDDIAAAKAYLDSKAGTAAGNLIVVGAGQGATLGQMWMTSECRRYRDTTANPMNPNVRPMLDSEPEGKDIVAGVWLTMSHSLEGTHQIPVDTWATEIGGKNSKYKMPMLFVYGIDDMKGKQSAQVVLQKVIPGYKMMEAGEGRNPDAKYKYTRDFAIEGTKLDGSQLLENSLKTKSVIRSYINDLMEDRGNKETKRQEVEKFRYYWVTPGMAQPKLAKPANEEFMSPINPTLLNVR
jgi:hypothetical protein